MSDGEWTGEGGVPLADLLKAKLIVNGLRRFEGHGFRGFASGLYVGDVGEVEYLEERYRVRVISCRIVPNCITPYVELLEIP